MAAASRRLAHGAVLACLVRHSAALPLVLQRISPLQMHEPSDPSTPMMPQGLCGSLTGPKVHPWRRVFWPCEWKNRHHGHWKKMSHRTPHEHFHKFSLSAVSEEWVMFVIVLMAFLVMHWTLLDWPSNRWYHGLALGIWFVLAAGCNSLIWLHSDSKAAQDWLTGYLFEFLFSLENVFVFQTVLSTFETPREHAQKALFITICVQILFQLVTFMGLAAWLQSIAVLPYLLGLWLVCLGLRILCSPHSCVSDFTDNVDTCRLSSENPPEGNGGSLTSAENAATVNDCSLTFCLRSLSTCIGNRFLAHYTADPHIFTIRDGKLRITMLGPVILCLLIIDIVMETDVTLAKIEEIDNYFIAFTSSAAAAFTVPELYFVARDFFQRFFLLHYGICFMLCFFGSELLLNNVVDIPDNITFGVIFLVLVVCVSLSGCWGKANQHASSVNW